MLSVNSVSAQAWQPYGSWRGRIVYRDGLFRTRRIWWYHGIMPTGALVFISAIENVPGIIDSVGTNLIREEVRREMRALERSKESERRRQECDEVLRISQESLRELQRQNRLMAAGSSSVSANATTGGAELVKELPAVSAAAGDVLSARSMISDNIVELLLLDRQLKRIQRQAGLD